MKKSVYSLVLMDDVVEAIDQMAYTLGTSRSNLINQILAQKVAYVTPEQHLERIFNRLSAYLKPLEHFQIQTQAADHMYSVKSALKYKYNPTIRYAIYLRHGVKGLEGEMRIISRTQSEVLYTYLNDFFSLWAGLEGEEAKGLWQREDRTKWLRVFRLTAFNEAADYNALADSLSEYIEAVDDGLKIYFTGIGEGRRTVLEVTKRYQQYIDRRAYAF